MELSLIGMVSFFAHISTLWISKHLTACIPSLLKTQISPLDHWIILPSISVQSTSLMALQSNDGIVKFDLHPKNEKINWIIRPATIHDREECAALIRLSYSSQLINHYSAECLEQCLPLITNPREELLTCNTWYLAEHPSTRQIVGCGGWTVRQPKAEDRVNDDSNVPPSCMDTSTAPPLVPHLRHFASHPDYPRCGIASAIWKRTKHDIAHQFEELNGRPFPILEVFSTLNAEPFYESCGFVVIERLNVTIAKDVIFPATLMRRDPTK